MGVQSASGMASMRFNEIAQAGTLADGDGEADLRLATDGDHDVGVEAAGGPHRELSPGPGVAHPSHGLPQEVGGAAGGVGAALAQRELSHPLNSQWACKPMREARRRSYPSEHFSLTHPSAASRMQSMAPS